MDEGVPVAAMDAGPPDGELDRRRPGPRSDPEAQQQTVAERSASRTVIRPEGVRVPAAAVGFFVCCLCLSAAGPGLEPAPAQFAGARVSRAALCPVALCPATAAARPAITDLGLWTRTFRRLRTPQISIRRFRTRVAFGPNTCATRQTGRYSYRPADALAGDIELNPGPNATPPVAPPGTLTVYQVNARSLKKQLGDLRVCAPVLERSDVIAITETWFNDTVADTELGFGFDHHTWFRRDRGTLGGGVACAVRSSLSPLRLPDPEGAEVILIRLQSAAVTIAVCCRPPDDDDALRALTDALAAVRPQDYRLIVTGDFNLPEITWSASEGGAIPRLLRNTNRATHFLDECDALGLKQWVCEPTRGDNVLDLMLTSRLPTRVDVSDSVLNTDHRETLATVTVPVRRSPVLTRRSALNYKRADFDGLRRSLSLIPWGLMDGVGVDEAVDTFYALLNSAIADHVPTVVLRRRVPPWFDGAVRAALRLKEAAYRRMRRNPSQATSSEFADRRRDFKVLSSEKYAQYLRDLTVDFKTNPKRYWSFLKCVTNKSSISPVLRASDGNHVTNDQDRAELLNSAFARKFTHPNVTVLPTAPAYHIGNLSRFNVSEAAVRAALKAVPTNKACGPDDLSARIIVECADELVVPVTKICNASVSSGVFPGEMEAGEHHPHLQKRR